MIIRIRNDFIMYYAAILLVFITCEGTDFDCTKTDTIYTKTENSAVFFADATYVLYFDQIEFYNTSNGKSKNIFEAFIPELDLISQGLINFNGPFEHRITVHGKGHIFGQMYITIVLKNIKVTDNGTYALTFDGRNAYCWTLFVLDIRSQNKGKLTPEGSTAIFEGLPQVSLGNALALNATFTWLLHGLYANQTTRMHVQGDMMRIPKVARDMEGWNVTYRCAEDTGEVVELNKTLRVMYMKVPKQNQLIEEGSAIFYQGYPPRQTYTKQGLQIVWLFDGYNLTQPSHYQFLEQGDKLWISYVSRIMDGKNVTYRSIESTGVENEINSTVRVSYGPNWPIYLSPSRKIYQERVGDIVPEIICYVDCNPACNLSWGIHSEDNILKLERITKETEGEYMCTARRMGTDTIVIETIYVYVQEEAPIFTVPIAVLAGTQTLSVCCIFFLLVCVLRSKKRIFWKCCCQTCLDKVKRKQTSGPTEGKPQSNECPMSTLSNEAYEDLRTGTRGAEMENYSDLEISEVYVNTTVDTH